MLKYLIAIVILLLVMFVPLFISNNGFKNMSEIKENRLVLKSPDFEDGNSIPSKYTCDGENINPKLEISGIDTRTKSLVLIVEDPDAPVGMWDHWVRFNIPPTTSSIEEDSEPLGVPGKGTSGNLDYVGPCPPDKEHRYFFKLYSLDIELGLKEGANKTEVEKAMFGHVLQTSELVGLYKRIRQ